MNTFSPRRTDRPLAARAILALGFGTLALAWPAIELGEFVLLFAAYVLLDGLVAVWAGVSGEHPAERWGFVTEGVVGCALGALAFLQPLIPLALLYLIATWGIVTGVLEIIVASHIGVSARSEWLLTLAGISSVFVGMLLLTIPGAGSLTVVRVISVYALAFSLLMFLASRKVLANSMLAASERATTSRSDVHRVA